MTLSIQLPVATETPYFWGTFIDGSYVPASEISLLNATPIKSLRFGGNQIDWENWSNGCMYVGGAAGVVCQSIQENPVAYAHLCQALPADQCVLGLPGEIASPSTDTYLMNWLYAQTGRKPSCWAMGNEPEDWTHYGKPWTSWLATDSLRPSASQFGALSEQMANAVRHDQPGTCIIGGELNSNPVTGGTWAADIAQNDPNESGIAFHAYPDDQCTGLGVPQLLQLSNLTNMTHRYTNEIVPVMKGVPVSVHEFNMALTPCQGILPAGSTNLGGGLDAAFTAANVAQALSVGMPQFDFFRFWCANAFDCMVNGTYKTPIFYLYADLFTHLDISTISDVTLSGANAETWAVRGANNATNNSLLVVNAAPYAWENVSLAGIDPSSWTGRVYAESAANGVQTLAYTPGEILTLPPQSEAVIQLAAPAGSPSGGGPTAYTVSGTVHGGSGAFLMGATVYANNSSASATTPTRSGGAFSFTLFNGSYTLTATASGYAPARANVTVVGTDPPAVSLTLMPQGHSSNQYFAVDGTVLSGANTGALANATVSFTNGSLTIQIRTDSAGHFSTSLTNATYHVSASAAGYRTSGADIVVLGSPLTGVNFTLAPTSPGGSTNGPWLSSALAGELTAGIVAVGAAVAVVALRARHRRQAERFPS